MYLVRSRLVLVFCPEPHDHNDDHGSPVEDPRCEAEEVDEAGDVARHYHHDGQHALMFESCAYVVRMRSARRKSLTLDEFTRVSSYLFNFKCVIRDN